MFDLTVKYLGFLKHIPFLPHLFDAMLSLSALITNRQLLTYLDAIEAEVLSWKDVSVQAHKFGGMQFNAYGKEIGHIHGNGILDALLTREKKSLLINENKAGEHHVFKNSGWVGLKIKDESSKKHALEILRFAYEEIKMKREHRYSEEKIKSFGKDHPAVQITFIVVAWLLTSLTLTHYAKLLGSFVGPSSFGREFLICGGQILFQGSLLWYASSPKFLTLNYLSRMMGISLMGSILLLPVLLLYHFLPALNPLIALASFLFVAGIMLIAHIFHVKKIKAPKWLSVSWILYRIFVLLFILLI